jgi:D-alanyl-D-alanine carboxypeptidase
MPADFAAAIESTFASHPSTPGIVVGIHRPDIGFAVVAHGLEFVCTDPPCEDRSMTAQHRFDIGSLMKSFRWVVILKLAEDGLLDLDDPVDAYAGWPSLPGVTFRDLMRDTSGMIDITEVPDLWELISADMTRAYFYEDAIGLLLGANGVLDFGASVTNGMIDGFAVGTDHHYSSFGAVIAGEVARNVTGKDARQLVKERILDPLRLGSTTHIFYDPKPTNVAQGYEAAGQANTFMLDYANTTAISSLFDGLMYSSACDLVHFSHQVFGDAGFLSEGTRSAMISDVVDAGGGTLSGLGVIQYGVTPGFWGHAGASIHGHSSYLAHRPSDQLSIVVLANIDSVYDNWQTHIALINALGAL